ncbi:hypothetical protein [Nonomuraea sp. NPDC050643]|uniref:hypothetical protein n=1 Tax=Nonomuraea sp. NPDC050643 TaxID=3155660 RepID=UPI0033E6DE88
MLVGQNRINYEITGLPPVTLPGDLGTEVARDKVAASPLNGRKHEVWGPKDTTETERVALLWLLAHYCSVNRRNMTYRVILPIPGSPAGGQVILHYDENLNGKATLVGRGLPLGGQDPRRSFEDLAALITKNYDLAGIGGTWTMAELTKLHHALALVPGPDRPALRGVQVQRVSRLDADRWGAHTQGRFSHAVGAVSGDWGTLTLTDAAFADDDRGFYGGSEGSVACPPSIQVILHEVGHAVESQVRRAESRAIADQALQIFSGLSYPQNSSLPSDAPCEKGIQLRYQDLKEADAAELLVRETFNLAAAKDPEAEQKIAACRRLGPKMEAFAQAVQEMAAGRDSGLAKALGGELQAEHRELKSWYDYARDMIGRDGTGGMFDPGEYRKIKIALAGKVDHRPWLTYTDELGRWADLQILMSLWRKKYVRIGGPVTNREQNLVDLIKGKGVGIDLTPYTKKFFEGDKSATEMYAEAYALWRVHPEALGSHSKELLAHFADGDYRKGD